MKALGLAVTAPVLLWSIGPVHVQAADFGQVEVQTVSETDGYFSLSATAGGVVMNLPDGGGWFEGEGIEESDDLLFGGMIGVSASAGLGKMGDLDAFVGFNAFGAYATGNFFKSHEFTGPGVVIIQGGAGPNLGSIGITTSSGGGAYGASMAASNTSPQGGGTGVGIAIAGVAGSQDSAIVSANGQSFIWGGASGDAPNNRAAAYAAIADTNGGVFIAAGDLDGLAIDMAYMTEVIYAGADLTFGLSGVHDNGVVLQGYAGPSYRYLSQRNSMNMAISVDVPEMAGGPTEYPLFGMQSNEHLQTHYLGGVAGLAATVPINAVSSFTLGGEVGLYYASAGMDSDGVYTVEGGGPVPYVLQTVTSEGSTDQYSSLAWSFRGTGVYTVATSENTQLSLSAMVDYLSGVATPGVNATVSGYDGTDDGSVTYVSGGSSDAIHWSDMIAITAAVTFSGQF
jgi:hypothetical protein